MKTAVCTYFTRRWCYPAKAWAVHVAANLHPGCAVYMVTDDSEECKKHVDWMRPVLEKAGAVVEQVIVPGINDDQKGYKDEAQRIIARLQQAAFSAARAGGAGECWSVEIDNLVPPNALRVLRDTLQFDGGYYSVAMVTYWNGQFLGGHGSPQRAIEEDFTTEERILPAKLKARLEAVEKKLKAAALARAKPSDELVKEAEALREEVRQQPPKGNVFALNAKKWRRRGWMDAAYPGIGRGAILPTDWVGLGCTLLNDRALALATFEGYALKGTQDLFLCWHRWHPAGLHLAVIPHIVCHHVKRDKDKADKLILWRAYHEPAGEFAGHLRASPEPFYDFN